MSRYWRVGAIAVIAACRTAPVAAPELSGDVDVEGLASASEVFETAISPDGTLVAYVGDATGELELWTVRADGTDRRQRTFRREITTHPQFSPDGRFVYFLSDTGGDERYDLYRIDARAPAAPAEQITKTEASENEFDVGEGGTHLVVSLDPEKAFRFDLYDYDLLLKKLVRLTHEDVNVIGPVWSRDGRFVAGTVSGDDQTGPLIVVNVETKASKRIAPPDPKAILHADAFSADGTVILGRTLDADGYLQLAVITLETGTTRLIARGEGDIEGVTWNGAGPVVFTRNEAGISRLYRLDTFDGSPRKIEVSAGVIASLSIDASGRRVSFAETTSTSPSAGYVLDLQTSVATKVTGETLPATLAQGLCETQLISYDSEGRKIPALLTVPKATPLGSPPPLLVRVHGGPNGQARPEFSMTLQAFLSAGFAVLEPNYRGSVGFGRAYEDANNLDWGGGDLRDIVAGVKYAGIQGCSDPSRAGIYGGSYGGYMTLRALTAAPGVFAAGAESFGMPDLVEDYNLTVDRFGDWYATEMGTPTTNPGLFRDRSPVHALDQMTAPLLVLQGENDTNVPRAESDLVVAKLRERGHPVDYTVYPGEGHGFTRRSTRVDATKRELAFFRKHLGTRRSGAKD